jgi:histidyl-tRNA synthetase
MTARFQAPKGTFDVLPADAAARERIEATARELLARYGYGRIETPVFEDTALFEHGVGRSTDIVRKEMFTFEDRGGRSLTLRPEGTASICRAYLEHGMQKLGQPVKLWYAGPYFRHERPQAGRFRQFTQVGAEAIGAASPLVDAELIVVCEELLRTLAVPELTLKLGSLGSPEGRAAYREELVAYLRRNEARLAPDVRERIDENPLRAFDAKDDATREVMAEAPTLLERLDGEDAEHFDAVRAALDRAGIAHRLDPTLVRGLDYYSRTVFAFECDRLGAQSEVGGGGRYDDLVAALGGPPTPAAGWAVGVDRILLATGAEGEPPSVDVFIAAGEGERERALSLAFELRRAGLRADLDLADRSVKGQMKHADRLGAGRTVILEGGTATLRDMGSGEQRPLELDRAVEELAR